MNLGILYYCESMPWLGLSFEPPIEARRYIVSILNIVYHHYHHVLFIIFCNQETFYCLRLFRT